MSLSKTGSQVGKVGPSKSQLSFFNQIVGVPNPLNPREVVVKVIPGSGISARDYFAAKIIANLSGYDDAAGNFPALARDAYKLADAMLMARDEPQTELGALGDFRDGYLKP